METELYSGILTGYFRESDTYSVNRPAGMNDWLIVYTLSGEGYFRTPSGQIFSGPGEVILLRKGIPHAYGTVPCKTWDFMWAHFRRLPETGFLPEAEALVCKVPSGTQQQRVLHSFQSLLADFRERGVFWKEQCENQLGGILLLVAEQLSDRMDARVSRVMRMLSARMQEPLTLEDIAQRVGLSASRLSHLFKSETGRTIVETLNGMRLEQAVLLMSHAGRTASEAAFDVGFQSYNHFAALFRRRFGVGPADYKKAIRH